MSDTEEEFAKFLCFCEKSLSGPSKQLINLVKKRYDECSDKFKGTQELYHLLSSCRKKMESDSRHLFVHLKDCLNELKAYAKGRKGENGNTDLSMTRMTLCGKGPKLQMENSEIRRTRTLRADRDSKLKDKQRESKLKISPNSACSSKLADIIRNLKDKKGGGDALCEDTVVSKGDSVGNGCTTNTDGDLKSEGEKKLELPESGKAERAVLDNDDDDDDCILIDDSPPHQTSQGSVNCLFPHLGTSIGFRPLTPDANNAGISSATNGTESTKDVVTGDQSAATDSSRSPSAVDGDHSNNDQHPSVNSGNDSGSPMISKTDLDVEMISDSEKDSDLKPDMKSDCADNEEDEKPKMSSTERTSPSVETCDTHEHSPGGKDMEISIPESQESSSESTALPGTSPPAATSLNTSPINTSIPSPAAEEDAHATSATEGSPGTSGITADSAPVITGGSGEPSVLRTSKPCNLSSGDTSEHSDLPVITADSPTDVMSDHCESPSGETSEHRDMSVVITAEQRDSPTDVMSEQCDSPFVVTAEHGDLPTDVMSEDKDMSVVITAEHGDSRTDVMSEDKDMSVVITEHGDSPTDVMSEQCDSPVIIAEHSDLPTDDCDVTSEHCDSPCDVTSEHCDSLRTNQTTGSTSQGSAVGRGEEKKKEEPVKKKEEPEKKRAEPEKKRAEPEKKREEPEKKRAEPEKKREEQEKKRAQPEKKKEVSEKHIHRLEKLLEKLETKIQQVQARELSLDDLAEEDSSYIYEDKLKKKFVAVWNKLCELKDRTPSTGRPTERRFNYQGTRYPEVNKKIEKMINKKKVFPDFHDMKRLVAKVSINQKLHLSQKEIESVAREAFTDVGNLLQQRRQDDYITTFGCRLTDYEDMNHDPAMYNAELKQKLEENQQKGKTNLENVIRKFSDMQYETGEEAVEVPEGSEEDERMEEEDERLDEEDASDEDVMEVNDEDLASDNEDLIKIKPRSKKRNIELVSDPEDRSPSSSPQHEAPHGPAARPDIVSKCWPQTSEAPPPWLAKSGSMIQPRSPGRQGSPSTGTPPPRVSRPAGVSFQSSSTPPPRVSRPQAGSSLSTSTQIPRVSRTQGGNSLSSSIPPPRVSRTTGSNSLSIGTHPPHMSRTPANSSLISNQPSGTLQTQVTSRSAHRSPLPIEVEDSTDDSYDSYMYQNRKNRMQVHDESHVPSFLDSQGDQPPFKLAVKKQFQSKPQTGKVLMWSSLGSSDKGLKRLQMLPQNSSFKNSSNKRAVPNQDSVHSAPFSRRPPSSSVSSSASVSPHKQIPLARHTSSPVRSMNVNGTSANRECIPPVKKEASMTPLKQAMEMSSQCYIDIDETGEEPDVYEVEPPPEEAKEVIVLSDSE
ncbi:microtubule-associated protein 1B-like [Haliotis rubra]|uniref:microtubule-associated protein 1B-like n=1 Tax=Haliotis rubra TaxID=36100 RepID=UPI001EE552DB|nr:microtubule-associated protein 1B-like [Haliotis rubra]